MLSIFLVFVSIGIAYLGVVFVLSVFNNFRKEDEELPLIIAFLHSFFVSFINLIAVFASLKFLAFFGITAGIFVVFSFMPYLSNLNDRAYIFEQEKNIELYNRYSEEYSVSARQQIEEFQKMQSEMAGRATVQQLQFWSLQQDEVGNALTEKIRYFQTSIREAELEMNKREARIEARSSNKWYFFLED